MRGRTPKWLKTNLHHEPPEREVFMVLGVTMTGPYRAFSLLDSFTLSPSHIKSASPLLVSPIDASNYDYVMVVRETVVKLNGWLK